MKKFYFRFRIMLMTFAFSLASVWMINSSSKGLLEVPVKLPQITTDNVLVVFPRYSKEMPNSGGGGSGGRNCCGFYEQIITKTSRNQKNK